MNLTVTKGFIYNMVWWIMHGEWSQTLKEREGRWLLSTVWHFLPAMVIHDIVLRGVQNVTGCHSNGTLSPRKEERLAYTLRFARMEPQLQQSDHHYHRLYCQRVKSTRHFFSLSDPSEWPWHHPRTCVAHTVVCRCVRILYLLLLLHVGIKTGYDFNASMNSLSATGLSFRVWIPSP